MKFDKFAISSDIKDNLEKLGYFRTTDIQFKTIPAILNGEDVLAVAQTGTGKTAAFAIPVIDRIHVSKSSKRSHGIFCLVMVPTRELAKQVGEVFAQLSKHTKASSYAIYGGVEQDQQIRQLAGGTDILIATPGRMFELIRRRIVDIGGIEILVLDEADRMLDLGFIKDIESVKALLKQRHQTLFFSATINPTIKKTAYSLIRANALRIQVSPEQLVSRNVTHYVAKVEMDEKRHLLVNFISEHSESKIIVFVRTQVRAERVVGHLAKNGIVAVAMHGGMEQQDREKNLESFRAAAAGVLVATDVSARGINVTGIEYVINYDLPDDPENYVHRVGRTGRGFAKGEAISFCSAEEKEKLQAVEELIQTKIEVLKADKHALAPVKTRNIENLSIAEMIAFEEARFEPPRKLKKKKRS
jgi:ATP-dependent RNA helicase RhlE